MRLSAAIKTYEIEQEVPVALFSGSFHNRLQKAAEFGYDGIELMAANPVHLDSKKICKQIKELGLEVSAIGSGAAFMVDKLTLLASDPDVSQRALKRLHDLIQFASEVEAPFVTIGSFRGRKAWVTDGKADAKLNEAMANAAGRASRLGVRLVLEPLNRYESDIVNNTKEGLALLEKIGHSHTGLLIDTYHLNIEEPSIHSCFQKAMSAGKLWHIHIGDSNRLPPGKGHLDFPGIVSTLREIGYNGYLSAELLPLPNPDQAAEETLRYMRKLIPPKNMK
ncbi:MAG: sugar phosphate isomerase/epimerase [Spirochaetota bacterium]|nr:MAG: sugar phosphate isomerase/epimerase [Spirochaetota bacterium]